MSHDNAPRQRLAGSRRVFRGRGNRFRTGTRATASVCEWRWPGRHAERKARRAYRFARTIIRRGSVPAVAGRVRASLSIRVRVRERRLHLGLQSAVRPQPGVHG
jgi:hypothetical protein